MTATVGPSTAPACRWFEDKTIAAYYVRWVAGRTLLDEALPVIAQATGWSGLPDEQLGDAFLSIVRDWPSFRQHSGAALVVRLEMMNAAIVEQHRQQIEGPAPRQNEKPAPRPTRKGKRKPRPKAGRR